MTYTVNIADNRGMPKIVIVGCGGTGGFVAEDLCRLLVKSDLPLLLVDHDRVERHNLRRQNFFEEDMDKFKSQALAERLARQFGRRVAYSIWPFDRDLINDVAFGGLGRSVSRGIIIGCVDTPEARKDIHRNLQWGDWWLDAGNGYQSGQLLLGDTTDIDRLKGTFNENYKTVEHLPAPSLQLPAILSAPSVPKTRQRDCAEAVEEEDQSPLINRMMATLVVDFVFKLLTGTLTWMGAYVDLETGSLTTVPADPTTVARMMGVKVGTLIDKTKPKYS